MMNANVIRKLFYENQNLLEEFMDRAVATFIKKVETELKKLYERGEWGKYTGITKLGIEVDEISEDFSSFDLFVDDWMKRETEAQDFLSDLTSFEVFDTDYYYKDMYNTIVAGRKYYEIRPFCKALERAGFKVYIHSDNWLLIDICI